jgi:hypothetical protein
VSEIDPHAVLGAESDKSVSFYFFDIDDNLLFLPTRIVLTHRTSREERPVSTGDFATIQPQLGKPGPWEDWEAGPDAYRNFEDPPGGWPQDSPFLRDIAAALDGGGEGWRGPSWEFFTYACRKQRPTAYITARGHQPETIRAGLALFAARGLIERPPKILDIFPVGNPQTRDALEAEARTVATGGAPTIADYKRIAIRRSVERAVEAHGCAPPHRFGMSDDDPQNVQRIIRAMLDCKMRETFAHMRFFVIDSHEGEHMKLEVLDMFKPAPRSAPAAAVK